MAEITPFAGLAALDPGESLATEGYRFQLLDRFIIDRILKVGAVTHRHDGHAAMDNPTAAPTVTVLPTGGTIPATTSMAVTYTLLDGDGGESLPVDVVTVTSPDGYSDPFDDLTCIVSYVAGTLLADNYAYGATVTDGLGGETAISPATLVAIDSGYVNGEVSISGLTALVNDASGSDSAAGWRLWRSQGDGPWYLIGTGGATTDTFTDNGVAGDCTVAPPDFGTTTGAATLTVNVPGGQPTEAVNFNVYVSLDGTFTSPALLGTYPIADAGTAQTYTDLIVAEGAPPLVSTCLPGANPVTAADLALNWLPPVASESVLPSSGNHAGDARVTLDTNAIYVWSTSDNTWHEISGGGGGGGIDLISTQETTTYTLQLSDAGTIVEMISATAVNLQVPSTLVEAFPVGTVIEVYQGGAGVVTVIPIGGSGVVLRSRGSRVATAGQYATIGLRMRANNEWVLSGDLA